MAIPLQLIALSLPAALYGTVRRMHGTSWREVWRDLGWRWPSLKYFLWALLVAMLGGLFAIPAVLFMPKSILESPSVNISGYAGMAPTAGTFLAILLREAFYIALGEEIFFRGLLGGWLMRRLGFLIGNTLQALLFLLPHLLLLLVSVALWPLLIAQLLAGWLLGWLRYRSDSILPGWLAHSLTNASSALIGIT
ncbi:MAG: CPBP family glutamic-type intramembrane protease [Anaerolineae bacterium]|nr:CPBP family glutamic-type intramembrane protease [Anaerolineae bacterium]